MAATTGSFCHHIIEKQKMGNLAALACKSNYPFTNYKITRFLRQESEVLWEWAGNRYLKQRSRTIRINGQRAIGREENCDLALGSDGSGCHRHCASNVGKEGVRVLAEANA